MHKIITETDLDIVTDTITVYSTNYNNTKYNDKDITIYASITHNNCPKCNKLKNKFYSYCDNCLSKNRLDNYKNKPLLTEWDYPIYCDYLDKYFNNEDELLEYIEDEEISLNDCLFYPCKLNTLPELDYDDLDVDEDYELPTHIQTLLNQLNELAVKEVISYSPDYRHRILIENSN